jgi:hypothetical protein
MTVGMESAYGAGGTEGLLPPQMAARAEIKGVAKARLGGLTLLTLGVLGGAFISFGALFSNVVSPRRSRLTGSAANRNSRGQMCHDCIASA